MENIVPCCIEMTLIKPNVDLNDAQQVFVSYLNLNFYLAI